jgi:hypothetical protein
MGMGMGVFVDFEFIFEVFYAVSADDSYLRLALSLLYSIFLNDTIIFSA